jgi:hypothetical protein
MLLLCNYYLDTHKSDRAAEQYLARVGNEDSLERWRKFVKKDIRQREERRRQRGRVCSIMLGPRRNSGQSSAQRQVSRYIDEFTSKQEARLRACLNTGDLGADTSDGSSGEGSDAESDDY